MNYHVAVTYEGGAGYRTITTPVLLLQQLYSYKSPLNSYMYSLNKTITTPPNLGVHLTAHVSTCILEIFCHGVYFERLV